MSSSLVSGIGSSLMSQTNNTFTSMTGGLSGVCGIGSSVGNDRTSSYNDRTTVNSNTFHGVITSSTSSHALTDGTGTLSGTAGGNVTSSFTGANISPLPVRAHQMNAMPPLCQVRNYFNQTKKYYQNGFFSKTNTFHILYVLVYFYFFFVFIYSKLTVAKPFFIIKMSNLLCVVLFNVFFFILLNFV